MSEHDLLKRLRAGDEAAFEAIFRAYYPTLVALAERMVRERAVAEEVVQDVFGEVWRRRRELVLTETLRAYLFRATRNRALNHLRHEQVVRRGAVYQRLGSTPPHGVATLVEQEIDAAVRLAVLALPERCREVFELSRGHGLKYAEIAAALNISIKTVEAQMGKALRILRTELAPWLPAGPERDMME